MGCIPLSLLVLSVVPFSRDPSFDWSKPLVYVLMLLGVVLYLILLHSPWTLWYQLRIEGRFIRGVNVITKRTLEIDLDHVTNASHYRVYESERISDGHACMRLKLDRAKEFVLREDVYGNYRQLVAEVLRYLDCKRPGL